MKGKLWLLTMVGVVLLCAVTVMADDGFYVIGIGGKPIGKEISSLPCIIKDSGMYYLSRNLNSASTSGSAISIDADNVTLDLMGFTLSGPGNSNNSLVAININGKSSVEVRNGCITNFGGDGVHCTGQNCRIIGLRVLKAGAAGISEGGQNQVVSCIASGCGHEGIWSGGRSIIRGNMVNGNTTRGITAGDYCIVAGNIIQDANGMVTGSGCTVIDNTATIVFTGNSSTVARNTIYDNFVALDYCTIANNTVTNASWKTTCIADNNCKKY